MLEPQLWLADAARDYMNELMEPDWVGVEYGSGGSTLWFAERVKTLLSIEHKANWYRAVKFALDERGTTNVQLEHISDLANYASAIQLLNGTPIDFVFVDGKNRLDCMKISSKLLKPGGHLIMDNTNEKIYKDAAEFGNALGWTTISFRGIGYNPKKKVEQECGTTTFWQKPR